MSKKPWFDAYCKINPGKLSSWPIQDDVLKEKWYHTIQLPNGVSTSGKYNMKKTVDSYFLEEIKGKKVLDVGAADGFFTLEMCQRGADVTAVEAHPTLVRHIEYVTKAHGYSPNVLECDIFSSDFMSSVDNDFDVVFCSHVICHIMERPAQGIGKSLFIDRLKTRIGPGGCLIATALPSEVALLTSKFKSSEHKTYDLDQQGVGRVLVYRLWDPL